MVTYLCMREKYFWRGIMAVGWRIHSGQFYHGEFSENEPRLSQPKECF
jgi:hypothetical protein